MRNWQASENPPRHWKPTRRHLRDVALRRDFHSHPYPEDWFPLRDLPWRYVVTLAEGIEKFNRMNPAVRGV